MPGVNAMNVSDIRRAAAGILFSAAILASPPALASQEGDAVRGEAAFAENCASCHASASRIMGRVEGDDDAAKSAALEELLPGHYAEDPEARADIIAFLLTL